MEVFKEIIRILCVPFGTFSFGYATMDLFTGDYKNAAWILFVVSILFFTGYFTEKYSR